MIDEQRKSLRYPVATRVRIKGKQEETFCMTKDISEGGMYLTSSNPPYIGSVLELELSLPGTNELLKLKGDVVWRKEGEGFGVGFLKLTVLQRKMLQVFINQIDELNEKVAKK